MENDTATRPVEYGFYDRLKAEFPSQIIVDVTEVCNLACIHCPHPVFKQSEHYSARYLEPELNVKLVEEVRDQCRGYTQYSRYTSELGHLSFCPADGTHSFTVIDYRNTTILETWQGEFCRVLRQTHLTNEYGQHNFRGQCPDCKQTRWPSEGRGCADLIEDLKLD